MNDPASTLERLRRAAVDRWIPAEHGPHDRRFEGLDVGRYVWVWFGGNGAQLARIRVATPVTFDRLPAFVGEDPRWWWVDVFWPTRGRWISSHRRVVRGLTPPELDALSTSGVVERNGA